ncbi:MAG: type II toxin-antitoxin system HipA family toxin [Alphaproteobacteria bacterium]|nr:type II toxin-antitoxin system HipA family toxin [Alphaproteobacteria bacterium]
MALPVFNGAAAVGVIDADASGPRFQYDQAWREAADAFPASLTMPLNQEAWGAEVATPWLMNLLPEGEPLRAMTRALGVSRDDILGLIAETGRDLAGALTIGAPRPDDTPGYREIGSSTDLERILEELPAKPFLVGEDGVSMSLAGAQEKLPVALVDGRLAVPINGAASTQILKPDNPRLPGSVQNEALCMVLARRCGLSVAPITTGLAGTRSYLLVERYDRLINGDLIRRLHQEDFCQALGRPPVAKYEHNQSGVPGPSLSDMFALVRDHMTAREITGLLDAAIFNIAIGNVDSHAKNYSVLLSSRRPQLAPLYDLMSGLVWPNITQNHAQDVGGQRRGRHILGRHWRRMAEDCGLSRPATLRRVIQLAGRVVAETAAAAAEVAAMPAGGGAMLQSFADAIRERALLVLANARREGSVEDEEPATENVGATYGDA